MKTKTVIGFKADQHTLTTFNRLLEELGIEDKSELAERAYKRGLPIAAEELRKEKMQKAKTSMSKLSALSLQALLVLRAKCLERVAC